MRRNLKGSELSADQMRRIELLSLLTLKEMETAFRGREKH